MGDTTYWRGVRVDDRTKKMLDEVGRLTPKLPYLTPSQGSYNTSVGASAGTHAGGGAVDIRCSNLTYDHEIEAVRQLRTVGFAAWRRPEISGLWSTHIHAIAIGCPDLSAAARDQVSDYKNGRDGLASNGPDPHRNLDIAFTTWEDYLKKRESMATPGEIAKAVLHRKYVKKFSDARISVIEYIRQMHKTLLQQIPFNSWMEKRWGKHNYSWRTYVRSGYGHSRATNENTEDLLKGQKKIIAELAANRSVMQQVLSKVPVDFEKVYQEASRAVRDVTSSFDVTIELNPAEEEEGVTDEEVEEAA